MLAAAILALAGASLVAAQDLTINTPSTPVFCQPTLFSWSGGTAPYYLTINAGGSTSDVLESLLSATDVTSYTWIADISAGTSITLAIKDSTGSTNYAQAVTVQENPSGLTTCASASSQAASQSSQVAAASGSSTAAGTTSSTDATTSTEATSSTAAMTSSTSSAAAATSSAAAATSSAGGAVSSAAADVSSAAASASSSGGTSGAFATFGVPVLTTGALAAGVLAIALL